MAVGRDHRPWLEVGEPAAVVLLSGLEVKQPYKQISALFSSLVIEASVRPE